MRRIIHDICQQHQAEASRDPRRRSQRYARRRSDFEVYFDGKVCEWAALTWCLGLPVDWMYRPKGGEKAYDGVLHGWTIEVKGRRWEPVPDLLFDPGEFQADWAIGAQYDGQYQVTLWGCVSRAEWRKLAIINRERYRGAKEMLLMSKLPHPVEHLRTLKWKNSTGKHGSSSTKPKRGRHGRSQKAA